LRFVHPHYQKMDMLRACSFPFDDCPLCVIFHRMKKDIKRFNLLEDAYPIEYKGGNVATKSIEYDSYLTEGQVIHGFLAYSIICKCYKDMLNGKFNLEEKNDYTTGLALFAKEYKHKSQDLLPFVDLNYSEDGSTIKFDVPIRDKEGLIIITNDFEATLEVIMEDHPLIKREYYRPYRDLIPEKLVLHGSVEMTLYQFKHRLIAIKFYDGKITTTFTYILVYFLLKYFETKDDVYLLMYGSLKNIISNTNNIVYEYLSGVEDSKKDIASEVLIKSLPFFLSAECAGKDNISINIIKWFKEKLARGKKKYTPNSYYPENGKKCPEYVMNEFFLQNGSLKKKEG
jgi:hypothetical protein